MPGGQLYVMSSGVLFDDANKVFLRSFAATAARPQICADLRPPYLLSVRFTPAARRCAKMPASVVLDDCWGLVNYTREPVDRCQGGYASSDLDGAKLRSSFGCLSTLRHTSANLGVLALFRT